MGPKTKVSSKSKAPIGSELWHLRLQRKEALARLLNRYHRKEPAKNFFNSIRQKALQKRKAAERRAKAQATRILKHKQNMPFGVRRNILRFAFK